MKIAKRLPSSKAEVEKREGYFDQDIYMGYNLATGCDFCDGTGFMVADDQGQPFLGVYANSDLDPIVCCPKCNPNRIYPRNACWICRDRVTDGRLPPLGNLYRGTIFNWGRERNVPFNGYLCEQCAATLQEDSYRRRGLRLIR